MLVNCCIIFLILLVVIKCPFIFRLIYLTIYDFFHKKEHKRDISGIYIFTGLFGEGKTLSMVRELKKLKDAGFNVYTNFDCTFQDKHIISWRDIVNAPPDTVIAIDEISYIFNNKAWKSMPRELFGYIVQQRKRNVRIMATAQDFDEVDKSIREKAKYIIACRKFGRLIINRYYNILEYKRSPNVRKREFTERFIREDKYSEYYNTEEIVKMMKDLKIEV